jgi:hypothetical protein
MPDVRSIQPAAPILIGAAVMLNLSMGVRQSLGLVMRRSHVISQSRYQNSRSCSPSKIWPGVPCSLSPARS